MLRFANYSLFFIIIILNIKIVTLLKIDRLNIIYYYYPILNLNIFLSHNRYIT